MLYGMLSSTQFVEACGQWHYSESLDFELKGLLAVKSLLVAFAGDPKEVSPLKAESPQST
jgi:hypothetical protein